MQRFFDMWLLLTSATSTFIWNAFWWRHQTGFVRFDGFERFAFNLLAYEVQSSYRMSTILQKSKSKTFFSLFEPQSEFVFKLSEVRNVIKGWITYLLFCRQQQQHSKVEKEMLRRICDFGHFWFLNVNTCKYPSFISRKHYLSSNSYTKIWT